MIIKNFKVSEWFKYHCKTDFQNMLFKWSVFKCINVFQVEPMKYNALSNINASQQYTIKLTKFDLNIAVLLLIIFC